MTENPTKREYDSGKVDYDGLVNVYQSVPDDSNLMKDFPCWTIMLRNNADTRNYLLTDANFDLADIPQEELSKMNGLELWKKNENPHRAFYFFDMLFGELEMSFDFEDSPENFDDSDAITFDDPGQSKLKKLIDNGYVFLRNEMGMEWEDYDRKETEMEHYYNLSQDEIDERDRNFRKKCLKIAYSLEEQNVLEARGIIKLLSQFAFQLKKRTIYKDVDFDN